LSFYLLENVLLSTDTSREFFFMPHWERKLYPKPVARKIYILTILTRLMTLPPPIESHAPRHPGMHRESVIAKNVVNNYIRTLVPELLVFFTIQNVGLRPLRYFCEQLLHYPISIPAIEQVIRHAGRRAMQRMSVLDLKAGELATTIEMDTTWKGRSRKFFAAIAREANYLFCLEPVKGDSAAAARPRLRHLREVCCNFRLAVTDMALGFEHAIPRVFRGVVHLFCHNHMLKAVDREMPEVRKDFLDAKKRLAKHLTPARTTRKWLKWDRSQLYSERHYRKELQREKVETCQQHDIPVKPNGALKVTKKGLPPFLRKLSARIGKAQAKEARFKLQVSKQLAKRAKVGKAVDAARKNYRRAWHKYAAARQVWVQFKRLLRATDLREFRHVRQKLERRIDKSPSKMANKVGEYLTLPQLNRYFRFSPEERAALGPVNTNRVEGFFSQMRVTLDGLRNAPDTSYIRTRLVLLRYWHNVVGPLSGPNAGLSPCHQLGIASRPGNPIRAICAGALLPKITPDLASWLASSAGVRV